MNKILVVSQPRSGSTWVYNSLCSYIAPEQLRSPWTWDEPFSDSLQDTQLNFDNTVTQPAWVFKTLVQHHNIHNQHMLNKIYRQSDCVVKLMRHPSALTISLLAAWHSNLFGDYTHHKPLQFEYKQIKSAVQHVVSYNEILTAMPADKTVYYEQLVSPQQTFNIITGSKTDTVMQDQASHSRHNTIKFIDFEYTWETIQELLTTYISNQEQYPIQPDVSRYK